MLAYAYDLFSLQGYKKLGSEDFDNIEDLCAAILERGIATQVKRGLHKEYLDQTEELSCVRGKFNMSETVKGNTLLKKKLVCEYDEFSTNSYLNRIIKTTLEQLLLCSIQKFRKKNIRRLLAHFSTVESLEIRNINWGVRFNRNNRSYRFLINICYLFINSVLLSSNQGKLKVHDLFDEKYMHKLYERFILEYFKRHYPKVQVWAKQIGWAVSDEINSGLPKMQSDIYLKFGGRVLIIDAKYYTRNLAVNQYEQYTMHSANLYQIFTYVKNEQSNFLKSAENLEIPVCGMLLYAKTDNEVQPDDTYVIDGNSICIRTLDLGLSFDEIADQLDTIIQNYFGDLEKRHT